MYIVLYMSVLSTFSCMVVAESIKELKDIPHEKSKFGIFLCERRGDKPHK